MFISSRMQANAYSNSTPSAAPWDTRPDRAAEQAISRFELRSKGWRGFDAEPWVKQLSKDYPQAIELAHTCSSHKPVYQDQARELFSQAPPQDRRRIQDYFAGKAGLEELSCRLSGAGAGLCDKRTAYFKIMEISHEYVNAQAAPSDAIYL